MQAKTLVIIPTYDERENVGPISTAVHKHAPEAHILFVDDNSPDGTGELLDKMAAADDRIFVLHGKEKAGLGRAYISGFKWGLERGYDLLFEMDADGSHDPACIPVFLDEASRGDLVLGTRYKGGIRVINWPLNRLLISMFAGKFVRFVTGLPVLHAARAREHRSGRHPFERVFVPDRDVVHGLDGGLADRRSADRVRGPPRRLFEAEQGDRPGGLLDGLAPGLAQPVPVPPARPRGRGLGGALKRGRPAHNLLASGIVKRHHE